MGIIITRARPGYTLPLFRLTKLLLLGLMVLISTGAWAQGTPWSLDRYPADLDQLGQALKRKNAEQGLVPVGIECSGGSMTVLSLHNSRLGASSYTLERFTDFERFKQGLNEAVQQGLTPVDLSLEKSQLFVLFLKLEATPENWAWVVSPPNAADIDGAVNPWISKGYQPMGITMHEGSFGTLLVRFKDRSLRGWSLGGAASEPAALTEKMQQRLAAGDLPFGLIAGTQFTNIVFLSWERPVAPGESPRPSQDSPGLEEQSMTLPEIESFILQNFVQP